MLNRTLFDIDGNVEELWNCQLYIIKYHVQYIELYTFHIIVHNANKVLSLVQSAVDKAPVSGKSF